MRGVIFTNKSLGNKYLMHMSTAGGWARPLRGHEHAAAGVVEIAGMLALRSYKTIVLTVDFNGWLTCTGTYSATTRRHIAWFMAEYFPNLGGYKLVKSLFASGESVNVRTGKRIPLEDVPKIYTLSA